MSTEAFSTRRVSEALAALEGYIDDAVKIAEGVATSKTLTFKLRDTPRISFPPQIDGVTWETGDGTIELGRGKSAPEITVAGRNLDRVVRLELHGPNKGVPSFTVKVERAGAHGFTVPIPLEGSDPAFYGEYDVHVVDDDKESATLRDGCEIVPPSPSLTAGKLELGAITPHPVPGRGPWKINVAILSGQPKQFRVHDMSGQDLGWHTTIVTTGTMGNMTLVDLLISPWSKGAKAPTQATADRFTRGENVFKLVASDGEAEDSLLLVIDLTAATP